MTIARLTVSCKAWLRQRAATLSAPQGRTEEILARGALDLEPIEIFDCNDLCPYPFTYHQASGIVSVNDSSLISCEQKQAAHTDRWMGMDSDAGIAWMWTSSTCHVEANFQRVLNI